MKQLSSVFCFFLLLCSYSSSTANSEPTTMDYGGAYLVFAKKMGGEISTKALSSACELGVAGCAKGSRIFSFKLVVIKAGKRTSFPIHSSNTLTKAMQASLGSLKAGDTFEFKQIKAYLPNGRDQVDVFAKRFEVI